MSRVSEAQAEYEAHPSHRTYAELLRARADVFDPPIEKDWTNWYTFLITLSIKATDLDDAEGAAAAMCDYAVGGKVIHVRQEIHKERDERLKQELKQAQLLLLGLQGPRRARHPHPGQRSHRLDPRTPK